MSIADFDERAGGERARDTRTVIMGAARRTFLTKGFHRATVDDITRAAELAHGTFYRYFRNKQEVLYGLMADTIASLSLPEPARDSENVFAAVRADLAAYLAHFWDHRDLGAIWMEAAGYDERIAGARDELRRPFLERVERSVRYGIDAGAIVPIDVTVAAQALATLGEHFTLDWLRTDASRTEMDAIAHTVALIWCRGLGFPVPD